METAEAEAPKVRTEQGREKPRTVSPLNGVPTPYGRRKGVPNKVTRTIREAVEIAARDVTDSQGRKGLAAWLLERANGTIADRQIFAAMIAKVVPLQVQTQGAGGVTINLGWLNGRQLINVTPTITAQSENNTSTINVLEHDTRTIHPRDDAQTVIDHQADAELSEKNQDDPPPPPSTGATPS